MSRATEFSQSGLEHMTRWLQETWQPVEKTSLCPASRSSQHVQTPREWSPGFPQLFRLSQCPPTSQGGLSPLCRTLGLELPICGSTCSLPKVGICPCNVSFPLIPSQGHRSQPNQFSSLPTQLHVYISYSLCCTEVLLPVSC